MAIAVLVVGHDEDLATSATAQAVAGQSVQPSTIVYANSIEAGLEKLAAIQLPDSNTWVWFLDNNCVPAPDTLEQLLKVTETSPSAALVAPKLVSPTNPRVILQYRLSVTKTWRPTSTVQNEFDQSQFDDLDDTLGAALFGSILHYGSFNEVGGFNRKLKAPTNLMDLTVRLRLSGRRVLLAPKARVSVATDAEWLIANQSELALRKSQIQLATGFANPLLTAVLGVLSPAIAVMLSIWLLVVKRPEKIGDTLAAGFWWFFTIFGKFARASRFTSKTRSALKELRVLFVSKEDAQRLASSSFESPAALAELESERSEHRPAFGESGGYWFMAALAALSWQFWPRNIAVFGGGLLPLSPSINQLFAHAGSSWQQAGLGLAAPADPFSWVLFALGCLTFWAPTLSVTVFLFLVKPLAFAAAWRALSLLTNRKWLLLLGAATYALWPALSQAQIDGRLGTLIALVLMPWFVFTLARVLQLGAAARKSVQTWSWVGISALLAAVISASAPSLTVLLALIILLLAIRRFKRIGYLMWIPVPLLVLWIPLGVYFVIGLAKPFALLTDPGVEGQSAISAPWKWLLGNDTISNSDLVLNLVGPFQKYFVFCTAGLLFIALFAAVSRRAFTGLALWLTLIAAVGSGYLLSQVSFPSSEVGAPLGLVSGSPYAFAGLAGLAVACLLVIALDGAAASSADEFAIGSNQAKSKARSLATIARGAGSIIAWLSVVILASQFMLAASPGLVWDDGTRAPALVVAQARLNPNSKTLILTPEASGSNHYAAQIVAGAGIHLDDLSVSYLQTLQKLSQTRSYQKTALAVANLVSGNSTKETSVLSKLGINYVLVPNPSQLQAIPLASTLDSVKGLEAVGQTKFGKLWRVVAASQKSAKADNGWSVTKGVQVSVLALFAILAVPTRRRSKVNSVDDDAQLDVFESDGNN